MPITPAFLQARAEERQQRLITYLPRPPLLVLACAPPGRFLATLWARLRGHPGALVLPLSHYTERQRLELAYAQNAFLCGLEPTLGDVQQFLWRLHPDFLRPDGELPNRRHPGQPPRYATPAEARRSRRVRAFLARRVPLVPLPTAVSTLRARLAAFDQDAPSGSASGRPGRFAAAPEPFAWDDLCEYLGRDYGLSRDEVLDHPRAWLFQLHRSRVLRSDPEAHLKIFAPSDALLA